MNSNLKYNSQKILIFRPYNYCNNNDLKNNMISIFMIENK